MNCTTFELNVLCYKQNYRQCKDEPQLIQKSIDFLTNQRNLVHIKTTNLYYI